MLSFHDYLTSQCLKLYQLSSSVNQFFFQSLSSIYWYSLASFSLLEFHTCQVFSNHLSTPTGKILKQNTKKLHYAGLKNSTQRISLIMYKRPKVIEVKKARFFWDTWSEIQPVKIFKRRVGLNS